jgi:hypothetical protein
LWRYANSSGALASSERLKQAGQFGPGDGSNTFSLPDLRGLSIRSWDDGKGIDPGRQLGSFQESQNLAHNHSITDPEATLIKYMILDMITDMIKQEELELLWAEGMQAQLLELLLILWSGNGNIRELVWEQPPLKLR